MRLSQLAAPPAAHRCAPWPVAAALEVARVYRFSPAHVRDEAVPVWVQIPITFGVG